MRNGIFEELQEKMENIEQDIWALQREIRLIDLRLNIIELKQHEQKI